MKFFSSGYLPLFVFLLFSCIDKKKERSEEVSRLNENNYVQSFEFQMILDTARVRGAIVVYDFAKNEYRSNDFEWATTGRLPASTYKIPHSIIALETGVVENDSALFKWNGEDRYLKAWEQDLLFKQAFQLSCVPCYKEVARNIGVERMNTYLNKLDYGTMLVDSTTIDNFWLVGDSEISSLAQIDFLTRLYESKLPISERTESIVKELMIIEKNETYTLRGKTGLAVSDQGRNGWFVGYAISSGQPYFFATNVEPLEGLNNSRFNEIRKEVTLDALGQMGVLK